jgi:hypothetical protein
VVWLSPTSSTRESSVRTIYNSELSIGRGRWKRTSDGDVHWRTLSGETVRSIFGKTSASRIAGPAKPAHVFMWLLDETRDDKGNVVEYGYVAEDLVGVDTTALHEMHRHGGASPITNRYLKRVRWGNSTPFDASTSHMELVFDYGDQDTDAPTPTASQRRPSCASDTIFDRTTSLCENTNEMDPLGQRFCPRRGVRGPSRAKRLPQRDLVGGCSGKNFARDRGCRVLDGQTDCPNERVPGPQRAKCLLREVSEVGCAAGRERPFRSDTSLLVPHVPYDPKRRAQQPELSRSLALLCGEVVAKQRRKTIARANAARRFSVEHRGELVRRSASMREVRELAQRLGFGEEHGRVAQRQGEPFAFWPRSGHDDGLVASAARSSVFHPHAPSSSSPTKPRSRCHARTASTALAPVGAWPRSMMRRVAAMQAAVIGQRLSNS